MNQFLEHGTAVFQFSFRPDEVHSSGWKLVYNYNNCSVPEKSNLLQDLIRLFGFVMHGLMMSTCIFLLFPPCLPLLCRPNCWIFLHVIGGRYWYWWFAQTLSNNSSRESLVYSCLSSWTCFLPSVVHTCGSVVSFRYLTLLHRPVYHRAVTFWLVEIPCWLNINEVHIQTHNFSNE